MEFMQTVEGAKAVVVRGDGGTEEMSQAEAGGRSKMLKSKCVSAKEVEADWLVPIRFER